MNLLGINADAKTSKGIALNVLTGILYLAPSDESQTINTCAYASAGCRMACLYTAGRGAMSNVRKARIAKTVMFAKQRDVFMQKLVQDVEALVKKAAKLGMQAAVRLNGTSDLPWENVKYQGKSIMDMFPSIQFYDYTKSIERIRKYALGQMPSNYHLTLSRSESNQPAVEEAIALLVNVAVVFDGALPETYMGVPVINGDATDVRFKDPVGVVVGLKAKGKAKKDASGFVVAA